MKNITVATIKSVIQNGGATFNNRAERVTMKSGYQVSKCDLYIIAVKDLTKDLLKDTLAKLNGRGEYLGVWIDEGKAYIDISCRIATKREAIRVGRELNQLSVLRWADGTCLAVN